MKIFTTDAGSINSGRFDWEIAAVLITSCTLPFAPCFLVTLHTATPAPCAGKARWRNDICKAKRGKRRWVQEGRDRKRSVCHRSGSSEEESYEGSADLSSLAGQLTAARAWWAPLPPSPHVPCSSVAAQDNSWQHRGWFLTISSLQQSRMDRSTYPIIQDGGN